MRIATLKQSTRPAPGAGNLQEMAGSSETRRITLCPLDWPSSANLACRKDCGYQSRIDLNMLSVIRRVYGNLYCACASPVTRAFPLIVTGDEPETVTAAAAVLELASVTVNE